MKGLNAIIITIGDELLIGQTIDTNSAYIAQELNAIGIWVRKRIAIGDSKEEIVGALEEGSTAALTIITGGLGPTADDITKPTLCAYFGGKMIRNEMVAAHVKSIFEKLNRPMAPRNLLQADVPDVCAVLHNARGTAPGMWFEKEGRIYISLPGVPHEMKGLMQGEVLPRLRKQWTLPALVHQTLLTSGVGESVIADKIQSFEESLPEHIKLAYLPSYGMVRLRLTGSGKNAEQLKKEVDQHAATLIPLVEPWLVATEDITLQEAVVRQMKELRKTLATAESCTGGTIAQMITSIAGASAVFRGSVVAYDNEVKSNLLWVKAETLQTAGAVSEETVRQMAAGALTALQSDYAVATSGIMGPGGATDTKPVGTVWIALTDGERTETHQLFFPFDRARNIQLTANTVLTKLFHFIKNKKQ